MSATQRELNKEVSLGANANQRHRWKSVKLRLQGGQITFNGWREFQSSMEESLQSFQPPPEEDLREHLITQVPTHIKREVAAREVGALRHTFWVALKMPHGVSRAQVLEVVGVELNLRIMDDPQQSEFLKVDCLTKELHSKALRGGPYGWCVGSGNPSLRPLDVPSNL